MHVTRLHPWCSKWCSKPHVVRSPATYKLRSGAGKSLGCPDFRSLDLILRLMWRGQQASVCLASLRASSAGGGEAKEATRKCFATRADAPRLDRRPRGGPAGSRCRAGPRQRGGAIRLDEQGFFRYRPRRKRLLMVSPDKPSDRIARSGPDSGNLAPHLPIVY